LIKRLEFNLSSTADDLEIKLPASGDLVSGLLVVLIVNEEYWK